MGRGPAKQVPEYDWEAEAAQAHPADDGYDWEAEAMHAAEPPSATLAPWPLVPRTPQPRAQTVGAQGISYPGEDIDAATAEAVGGGATQAFLQSAAQGVAMGLGPTVSATMHNPLQAIRHAVSDGGILAPRVGGFGPAPTNDDFTRDYNEARGNLQAHAQEHPVASAIGEMTGMALNPLTWMGPAEAAAPALATRMAEGLGLGATAARVMARLAPAASVGGRIGALSGFGHTEGSARDRALGALGQGAEGIVLGAGTAGLVEAGGAMRNAVRSAATAANRSGAIGRMADTADELRVAAGGYRSSTDYSRLRNESGGVRRAAEGLRETGISTGIHSPRVALERGQAVRTAATDAMNSVTGRMASADPTLAAVDERPLLPVLGRYIQRMDRLGVSPGPVREVAEAIYQRVANGEPQPFAEAHMLRQLLDDTAQWGAPPRGAHARLARDASRVARRLLSDEMDAAVARVGGDDLLDSWRSANRDFGISDPQVRAARRFTTQQSQNRMVSGLETVMAGMGGAAGHQAGLGTVGSLAAGAAAAGASRAVRTYGHATVATGIERLLGMNPGRVAQVAGAEAAQAISQAAQQGQQALAARFFVLAQQNPQIRALIDSDETETQQEPQP